jgi:hypothetical protein
MNDRVASWIRKHQRALTLLLVLLLILFNFPSFRLAMEGMINGILDGYRGQPNTVTTGE